MSEIADLENRLSAALDRIAQGIDKIDTGSAPIAGDNDAAEAQAARIAELEATLEAERAEKAVLEDQIQTLTGAAAANAATSGGAAGDADLDALKQAHAEELEYMRAVSASEREAWEGLNSRLVRLRRTNKLMRSNAAAMRHEASMKVADPEAINQSLQSEFEALQAAYELERAETDVILKTLQPLLGDPEKDAEEAL